MFNRIKRVQELNHKIDCTNFYIDTILNKIADIQTEFGPGLGDNYKDYVPSPIDKVTVFDNLDQTELLIKNTQRLHIMIFWKLSELRSELENITR